jgi:hypothetical protein
MHKIYAEALDGVCQALGSQHPWTSQLQNNTAYICIEKKRVNYRRKLTLQGFESKVNSFWSQSRAHSENQVQFGTVSFLKD